jgi:hypothetical protein
VVAEARGNAGGNGGGLMGGRGEVRILCYLSGVALVTSPVWRVLRRPQAGLEGRPASEKDEADGGSVRQWSNMWQLLRRVTRDPSRVRAVC